MKGLKWIGIAAAFLLLAACWMSWVTIHSKNIAISGMHAEGTPYGKPGLLHIVFATFFIVLSLIPRLWAKRFNLLVTGLNAAWMLRNFLLLSLCRGGECPERESGIYWLVVSSLILLIAAIFTELPAVSKVKTD